MPCAVFTLPRPSGRLLTDQVVTTASTEPRFNPSHGIDQIRRTDDVGNRIPFAEFVEADGIDGLAVNLRFGFGQQAENFDRMRAHRRGQCAGLQMRTDIGKRRMRMMVRGNHQFGHARFDHAEAQSGQGVILMLCKADVNIRRQARGANGTPACRCADREMHRAWRR